MVVMVVDSQVLPVLRVLVVPVPDLPQVVMVLLPHNMVEAVAGS